MRRLLPCTLFATLFLSACGFQQPEVPKSTTPKELEVSVDISTRHRCSRISPEITVSGIPDDVETLDIILEDTTNMQRAHGGGSYDHDDDGSTATIPEGALTRYYTGPCPSAADNGRIYQYVVKAFNADKRILAAGTYAFEQE